MNITATFYLNQSLKNIKKSLLTIFSLGLAISLITGITLYFTTANYYNVSQKFVHVFDFSIIEKQSEKVTFLNFSERFDGNEANYLKTARRTILSLESVDPYLTVSTSNLLLFKNYSQENTIPAGLSSFESSSLCFSMFSREFFSSQRFQDYFEILEGTTPQNENEIIIDALLAAHLDLRIQSYSSIPIFVNTTTIMDDTDFHLDNITIVGIFAPKRNMFAFDSSTYFQSPYRSTEDLLIPQLYQFSMTKSPFFGYFDYEREPTQALHPFNAFLNDLNNNSLVNNSITFVMEKGIGLSYNRNLINVNRLSSEVTRIGSQFNRLKNKIPIQITVNNYMNAALSDDIDEDIEKRAKFALTTIPVILFSLYLGSMVINMNFKSRYDEFLSWRTKGMPKKAIRNQLLFESVIIGAGASVISIILSIGVFYIIQPWLNSQFLNDIMIYKVDYYTTGFVFNPINPPKAIILNPIYKISSLLSNFLYCVLLTLGSSLFSFIKLKNLKIHQMKEELNKKDLNVLYSELIYEAQEQLTAGNKPDHDLYETPVDRMEKKIPKWGLKLIIPTIIPFLITLIYMVGTIPNIPDVFLEVSASIGNAARFIMILAFLMPILLVVGIVRYMVVESPVRFAKISKKIASLVMKEQSNLIGLEIIRRKPYRQMIFMLSLLTSLLVFANVNINTLNRKDVVKENFEVGADIHMTIASPYDFNDQTDFYTPMILNLTDLQNIEDNSLDIRDQQNERLFTSVVSVIINNYMGGGSMWKYYGYFGSDDRGMTAYLDLADYRNMIGEENKLTPNKQLSTQLQETIDYNKKNDSSIPGVIVNHRFLEKNNVEVGDTIEFPQQTYNISLIHNETVPIRVKILHEINILPGISPNFATYKDSQHMYMDTDGEIMLIDSQFLNKSYEQVQIGQLLMLFDLKNPNTANLTDLTEKISDLLPSYLHAPVYSFYEHEWNSLTQNSFTLPPSKGYSGNEYYGMLYLNLLIIGFLCALGLAIINLSFQQKNEQIHGLLLVRGFGKKKLVGFVLTQLFVIFSLSLLIGLIGGFLTSWAWMKTYSISGGFDQDRFQYDLPVLFNIPELAVVLGVLVGFSFLLYFTSTYFRMRKPINQYFYKF
ncbi:FtsX-like permease family protein [Candidatus Lokiarchaeum ossiferum]|uniref:FtsX-like permease family protein n=1 Tax=Candidatus Lokiarchaeum ossiferum TaxID=2951803 RepID=UPI00352F32ED